MIYAFLLRIYAQWVFWYTRRQRHYRFKGLKLKIPPGIFHPGLFFSTPVLADFLDRFSFQGRRVLDVGTGSGLLALYVARRGAEAWALDINPFAVQTARENAETNGLTVKVLESDLFEGVGEWKFDDVLVNPPYYAAEPKNMAQFAFFAGENLEYFNRFFAQLPRIIYPQSRVWMVLSTDCRLDEVEKYARENGFSPEVVWKTKRWGKGIIIVQIQTYLSPDKYASMSTNLSDSERLKHYTGSFYQGNYVWGGAMNLCWTELCQSVVKAPIDLRTDDPAALDTAGKLNRPVCTIADIDEPSYYVKAGFGPETLATINRECKAKFPEMSFPPLTMDLTRDDILSYAYFFKKVAYEKPFSLKSVWFDGQEVEGFEAAESQKSNLEVLHYRDAQQFILRIRLKNPEDELLLAKGYDTSEPAEVLGALEQINSGKISVLGENDHFKMPLLQLKYRRDYSEMIGKPLANKELSDYTIGQMFEDFAFELDEAGARVENRAVIMLARGRAVPGRYFYLDKPFWVIMKRTASPNPYFLLGVNNTGVMRTSSVEMLH